MFQGDTTDLHRELLDAIIAKEGVINDSESHNPEDVYSRTEPLLLGFALPAVGA